MQCAQAKSIVKIFILVTCVKCRIDAKCFTFDTYIFRSKGFKIATLIYEYNTVDKLALDYHENEIHSR